MRTSSILSIFVWATAVLGAPVRQRGPGRDGPGRGGLGHDGNGTAPTFTFTLSDGSVKTETLTPLSSGAPRPTEPLSWTYTLSSGVVETVIPQFGRGRERGVVTVTLADGSLQTITLPSPTGTMATEKPTEMIVTVTNTAGTLETITLPAPSRGPGRHGHGGNDTQGSRGAYTVTLSDGSIVTGTLPSPTGTWDASATRVPPVITATNSAGALETFTLTRPAGGRHGHGHDNDDAAEVERSSMAPMPTDV
jgi:hypothetical protein